jgi:UDP-N-acetylmuramoylalanine--D-glutamate ligase
MITVNPFGDKTVGVLGLGRSGLAAARALLEAGAVVVAWDDNAARREEARFAGFTLSDPAEDDWTRNAALILSPGIPLTHPTPHRQVAKAKAAGIPVIGDVELFAAALADQPEAATVAITGTNGKSTTTALVAHVFHALGIPSVAAGNIGRSVMSLDALPRGGAYVLEVSSYQIDLAPSLKPDIAVLLNITPDHLDRHGGLEGYVAVKRKLFANQTAGDWAIVGIDDPHCAGICAGLIEAGRQSVIPVSVNQAVPDGVYARDGKLVDATDGTPRMVGDLTLLPTLKGLHNWQNAAAAYAAVSRRVDDPKGIFDAMMSFPGLPHRMEQVGEAQGVLFINDSKATNQASAARALASFSNIRWVAGGIAKEDHLDEVRPFLPQVAKAYLIGRDGPMFERLLAPVLPTLLCRDLTAALEHATEDAIAQGGGTVLLSPAAASLDQFRDYEDRGDQFRAWAQTWIDERGRG